MAQCPTCSREYNVQDYLAHKDLEKANATITELRIDRDRWMEDAMGKASTINRLAAATEDRNKVDEIREKHHQEDLEELRAKLADADCEIEQKQVIVDRLNTEIVKLRAAVPEDVEKAINRLEETCNAFAFNDASSTDIGNAKNDLLSLIGSLITRSKEKQNAK